MRRTMWIKASFKKETSGCDDSQDTENQHRRDALGKISDVSQVMPFLSKGVSHDLSEAFKVGEWQFDRALLSPGACRGNGRISYVWQRKNSGASKVRGCRGNPRHADGKQNQGKPLCFGDVIELS